MNTDKGLKKNGVPGRSSVAKPSASKAELPQAAASTPDVAVADVIVNGGFLQSVSGTIGAFAVPAFIPADAAPVSVTGTRRDLGVMGAFTAPVPSQGNTLRLATVPFRVLNAVPAEGATAPVGSIVMLMLSGPADPASVTGAKLMGDAEVPVRRALSQDGKTIFLTPEQPLTQAASYRIVADGLLSLGGEPAPAFEGHFQTTAAAVLPSDVDFSRIKLSYPDASFNVTLTIPEGALPPRAVVEIEANGMGSYANGTMPDTGGLTFTIKAALGERLKIRVQLKDGRVFEGWLSRYESSDGSGRVTVGIDGGRIEAVDGSGAAVFLPAGTVDHPVEFKCQFTNEPSEDLLPELQSKVSAFGRVQLLAKEAVAFRKFPRIEMNAPEGTEDLGLFHGFGSFSVFYRNTQFDSDGQPATFYEFLDTARVDGGKLKGMGGMPWNELERAMPPIPDESGTAVQASAPGGPPQSKRLAAQRQGEVIAAAASPTDVMCYIGVDDFPSVRHFSGRGYLGMRTDDTFLVELDGMIVKDPGKIILKGRASTQMPDLSRKRTVGAPLVYAPGDVDVNLQGRLLTRTNECGSYMLMNAMWFDEPLQDSGSLLCIEPDFGIRKTWGKAQWILWQEDTMHDRKLYQIPGFLFQVQPSQMGDQTPPWMTLRFGGPGVLSPDTAAAGPLDAVVQARDNRDGMGLTVEVRVDDVQAALCGTAVTGGAPSASYDFTSDGTIGVWSVHLQLTEGKHRVMALVTDRSGNTTKMERVIHVMNIGGGLSVVPDPANPPGFDVIVTGGKDSAKPDTLVKVQFSEPVQNVSSETLHFEKLVDSGWIGVPDARLILPEVVPGQVAAAWFLPSGPLELDGHYRVSADAAIKDTDPPAVGGPKALVQEAVEFHVQAHVPLGTALIPGAGKIAAMGRSVFVSDSNNRIHMLLAMDHGVQDQATFGDFQGQSVDALMAFDGVAVNGVPYPGLLLVTTSPGGAAYGQNSVLWGFSFCAGTGAVQPLFSLSLGVSTSGYAPQVDYRDGVISVGRLTSSVALIRLADLPTKAPYTPALAVSPGGFGQGGIFQAFYMADPEYIFNNAARQGVNYGVALVPTSMGGQGGSEAMIRTLVAFGGDYTAQWRGRPIVGMPSFWLPYTVDGTYKPMPAFVADALSQAISETLQATPANAYLTLGDAGGRPPSHICLWPNASVTIGGSVVKTTLALGLSALRAPGGGNSLVIKDVLAPEGQGQTFWLWPSVSPFGAGVPYEIQYRKLSMDEATGLCAVEVKNGSTGKMTWFILDLSHPENPQVVDSFLDSEGAGWRGALSYGIFSATNANGVSSWKVLDLQGAAAMQAAIKAAHDVPSAIPVKGNKFIKAVAGKDRGASAESAPVARQKSVSPYTRKALVNRMNLATRVAEAMQQVQANAANCTVSTQTQAKIFAVSINQGVEKVLEWSGASGSYLDQDQVLPHKVKVPVVANRPGKLKVWLSNATTANTPARVRLSVAGQVKPEANTTVKPGNPDLYGFTSITSSGGIAEFDLSAADLQGNNLSLDIAITNSATTEARNLSVSMVRANRTLIHLYALPAYWREDSAGNRAGTPSQCTTSEINVLAGTLKKRFQAYFPVGSGAGDVDVSTVPGDFPAFTWQLSEGPIHSGGHSKLLRKWSAHVRRYLRDHAFGPDDRAFFVLVVRPETGQTHQYQNGLARFAGGVSWVPESSGELGRTPALMGMYITLIPGTLSMPKTMDGMVDGVFIHELGHSHGREHQTSTAEYATPTDLETSWPGGDTASRGQTNWQQPGIGRYGDARVGVAGWDFDGNKAVPFGSGTKKYTVMAYTANPWASDYDWASWTKVNMGSQDRPGAGESDALRIEPELKQVCPNKTQSFVGMRFMYEWPVRWEIASATPLGTIGQFDGAYQAPNQGGREIIRAESIDRSTPEARLEFTIGVPSLHPASGKLFVGQTLTFRWAWDALGTDTAGAETTNWNLENYPSNANPAVNTLAPFQGAQTVFTAPGTPGIYEISAFNGKYACGAGSKLLATIEVRKVELEVPFEVFPATKGQQIQLRATARGGWTNALSWTLQGDSSGDHLDTGGTFTPGPVTGEFRLAVVRVASAEDPRVYKDIQIFITKAAPANGQAQKGAKR